MFCPRTAWRLLPFCTRVASSYTSSSLHTPDRMCFSSSLAFSRGALPQDCCCCRTYTDIQYTSEAYVYSKNGSVTFSYSTTESMHTKLTSLIVYLNSVSIPETSLHLVSWGPSAIVLGVGAGIALLQLRARLSSKQRRRWFCIVDLSNLKKEKLHLSFAVAVFLS